MAKALNNCRLVYFLTSLLSLNIFSPINMKVKTNVNNVFCIFIGSISYKMSNVNGIKSSFNNCYIGDNCFIACNRWIQQLIL